MTANSLITAVTVGLFIGVIGRLLTRRARLLPLWLPVSAAVGAAVLAAIIAERADADRPGPTVFEVILQVVFAVAGVTVVAVTADRREHVGADSDRD